VTGAPAGDSLPATDAMPTPTEDGLGGSLWLILPAMVGLLAVGLRRTTFGTDVRRRLR
jgi:hypothetical protein